jgi:hypothetical protein
MDLLREMGLRNKFLLMIGGAIFGIAFLIMVLTEGAMGVLELPALLGNVLSYARIAAVGLVGLLLAELINETFVPHPEQGIVYALIMLPILIFLHLFNMGLAMFECIVQGGRLNLVEFFGSLDSAQWNGGRKRTLTLTKSYADYRAALTPLLRHAKSLSLIDPWLNSHEARYFETVTICSNVMGQRGYARLLGRIDIHAEAGKQKPEGRSVTDYLKGPDILHNPPLTMHRSLLAVQEQRVSAQERREAFRSFPARELSARSLAIFSLRFGFCPA